MRHRRPYLIFPCLCLTASIGACRGTDSNAGDAAGVVWDDPSGDVTRFANLPDLPLPDLTRMSVDSANGDLVITMTITEPVATILGYTAPDGKKRGATLSSLFLDVDNNPSTGGMPFARNTEGLAERTGYDRSISVQLGYLFDDPSGASGMSSGDVVVDSGHVRITGSIANYYVYALSPERRFGGDTIDPESIGLKTPYRDLTRIDGNRVELRVPYAALGTKAGDTVRLCFHDTQQDSVPHPDSVSADRTLVLK